MTKMEFKDISTDEVKWVTDEAVLIDWPDDPSGRIWLPRSTLSTETDNGIEKLVGQPATLKVHTWFAEKKGL